MTVPNNSKAPATLSQTPLSESRLLHRILYRIRRSLDLQDILNSTVMELQAFLGTDRVKIYQFHADGSGEVVAECLSSDRCLPSLYGLNFPADDVPADSRRAFVEARVRNVIDVETGQIGQSQLRDPETGDLLTGELVWRPLDPCHATYLKTMGVRASIVAPILHQDQLWGLIVSHHSQPMEVSEKQLYGVQLLVEQLSVAISQAHYLTQAQAKADHEATINRIAKLLDSLSAIDLQQALEETVEAFQASGGRLFIQADTFDLQKKASKSNQLYICGNQPITLHQDDLAVIELSHIWQQHFKASLDRVQATVPRLEDPQPWAISDLYQLSEFRNLQPAFRPTSIRSVLTVPLYTRQQVIGYLTIFRDEYDTETLWAGRFDPDARQMFPRQSFELWRESKPGQVYEWTTHDLELAQVLANRFATAIDQYELYQQVQVLNTNLEMQVQERTTQLSQALQNLQQAQTQLIQNEKMTSLGQLVAGVAHEINNPVNFIHGNLTHVSQYVEDVLTLLQQYQEHLPHLDVKSQQQAKDLDLEFIAEDLPKSIASMKLGTERICQIVQSLRSFSRLDQAEIKAVDIHEGIDSTLMILQHRLKSKPERPEIQVIKEYGTLPNVECYAGALNQVFMNLLSNAIDALEEKMDQRSPEETATHPGFIHITTHLIEAEDAAPRVKICIADNGIGIPEATRKHLFDPFFTTKPVGKGTGLGLSISHQVIQEKHHGSLVCVSQPNQGTEFIIDIPLKQTTPN